MLLLTIGANSFAQKKNGIVYSEHETIDKTRELWKAFVNGDEAKYRSFFADTAFLTRNDNRTQKLANAEIGNGIADMSSNYKNFMVRDQKPAFPDAIEYKEGGTWVQDWLLMTGIHKETGIILELPLHNLYRFNEKGKITSITNYFNDDVFEEIGNSQRTRENGKVYINHPYIITVRKVMNALVAKNMEEWASYFSPDARFSSLAMQLTEKQGIEEWKESAAGLFLRDDLQIKLAQVGYPDCIFYEKSGQYSVYSWWNMIIVKDNKKIEFLFMVTHDFNEDGKIVFTNLYSDSNHLEGL